MKLYVATKWENIPRAIEVADQLKAAGHTLTYSWWECEQASAEQASKDMKGVYEADAMVLIVEHDFRYNGALTEFGMALAYGLPVYVMGHAIDSNIFLKLPWVYRGIETLLQATHSTAANDLHELR